MSDEEDDLEDEEDEEEITSDDASEDHKQHVAERGEKGRWVKGKSANPKGRPKGLTRLQEDVVKIKSAAELAALARRSAKAQIEKLEQLAASAKKESVQLGAIGMLQDRGFGKPNQPLSNEQALLESRDDLGHLIEALRAELQSRKAQPALPAPLDATPDADGTFVVEAVPPTSEPER